MLGGKKHAKPSNTVRPGEHTIEIHPVVTPPELHYMKSVAANEVTLPDNEDESACKKPSNLNRFYERTAGIMALVRQCSEFCRDVYMRITNSKALCLFTPRSLDDPDLPRI